jgi:hypothetical protein
MIKVKCLAVGKHSRFFVGDICNVTAVKSEDDMKTGIITIVSDDVKSVTPFRFSNAKNLVTKTEAFRVLLVPVVKS